MILDTSARESAGADRATQPEPPELAPGVELMGEMPETGFQDRQWLVMRQGQFVQLTELLYRICEHCDGEQSLEQIADAVSASTDWSLDASQVELLIEKKLAPIGLVWTDSTIVDSTGDRVTSPLRLQLRTKAVGPAAIDPVTRVLQALFAPVLVLPLLALVAVAHAWLYVAHGLSETLAVAFRSPVSVVVVLRVMLVPVGIPVLGHG